MPEINLREYQKLAVTMVRDEIKKGNRRILLVLPTGSGKTHVLADIAKRSIDNGHKVLAMMHRRQLVDQMSDRFQDCGIDSGVIMAGREKDLVCKCQIVTTQTYSRRLKLEELAINDFFIDASVVLCDEGHHVMSKTHQGILKKYKDKIVIGCTATACLSSDIGLGNYYDSIVQPIGVQKLIDQKYLVPAVYYGPSEPDLSKLKTVAGDYEKAGLNKIMNQPKLIGDVVSNWLKIAGDKKTMCFAVKVSHSKALRDEFLRYGISAKHLDAHSDDQEREETLEEFRSGETQVLTNVGLYTEGSDIAEIEAIILARPTKSLGLHLQLIGRGARPCIGKDEFIVIDHGGNVARLGYYEDEIVWGLNEKEIAAKKEPRKKEKKIRDCPMCSTLFTGARCYKCGYEIKEYKKLIETEAAELEEITKGKQKKHKATMEEKRKFYGQLEFERRMRGYKPGWLYHKYLAKFGVAPHHSLKDTPPLRGDVGFDNWMRYQNIKWAKSKKKAA